MSERSAHASRQRRIRVDWSRGAHLSAALIAPSTARTETSARSALLGLLVAAWFIVAMLFRNPLYDEAAVVGSALMLAGVIVFFSWQPAPERHAFRFLGFFVFLHAFMASGANILQDIETIAFTPTTAAFSFAIESSLVFAVAFLAGASVFGGNIAPVVEPDARDPGLRSSFLVVMAVATTVTSIVFSLNVAQAGSAIGSLGTLPLVLLNPGLLVPFVTSAGFYQQKRGLPLAIVLVGHAFLTLMSSAIGAVAGVMRDVVFTHVLLHRRLPRGLLVAAFGIVMILNPAKHAVRRDMASGNDDKSMNSVERAVSRWSDALADTWLSQGRSDADTVRTYSDTPRRFDYNWVAAHIYTLVPNTLPFEEGTTYEDIPMMLVPRLLMPDKPTSQGHTRSRWTVKLGMQSWESASTTAIAIPAPFEAYWNFGWAGVIAIPFGFGLLVGAMLQLAPRDPVSRAGYVVLLANSLAMWLDMLVWLVPSFISVGVAAVLVRLFYRLGQRNVNVRTAILRRVTDH